MRRCMDVVKRLTSRFSDTFRFALLVWILMCAALVTACKPTETGNEIPSTDGHSKLINNATIVDGTGAPGFLGDVRISGNMIVAVGDFETSDEDPLLRTGLCHTESQYHPYHGTAGGKVASTAQRLILAAFHASIWHEPERVTVLLSGGLE